MAKREWGDDEIRTTLTLVEMLSGMRTASAAGDDEMGEDRGGDRGAAGDKGETTEEEEVGVEHPDSELAVVTDEEEDDAGMEGPPEGRVLGTVERFSTKRGFGLIALDNGETIFAHWTNIISTEAWPQLLPEMRVEFAVTQENGKTVAKLITAPGGTPVLTGKDVEQQRRELSDFAVTGTVSFFHHAGYGFISIDSDVEFPEQLPAGSSVYVSREDLVMAEGSRSFLEKGMRVRCRLFKPEGNHVTAAEVTGPNGMPIVFSHRAEAPPTAPRTAPGGLGVQKTIYKESSAVRKPLRPKIRATGARYEDVFEIPLRSEGDSAQHPGVWSAFASGFTSGEDRNVAFNATWPGGHVMQATPHGRSELSAFWDRVMAGSSSSTGQAPAHVPVLPIDIMPSEAQSLLAYLVDLQARGQQDLQGFDLAQLQLADLALLQVMFKQEQFQQQQSSSAVPQLFRAAVGPHPAFAAADAAQAAAEAAVRGAGAGAGAGAGGAVSAGMAARARKPCRFFQDNRCAKGADCTFLHDPRVRYDPTKDTKKPPICKFFAQGKCQKEACTFLHDLTDLGAVITVLTTAAPCKFFAAGRCRRVDCPFRHVLGAGPDGPTERGSTGT